MQPKNTNNTFGDIGPVDMFIGVGKKSHDLWSDKSFSVIKQWIIPYMCLHPAKEYALSQLSTKIDQHASLQSRIYQQINSKISIYKWLIMIVFTFIFKVGILDVDLHGPSIPRMMHVVENI